jgi:hypothetical protein
MTVIITSAYYTRDRELDSLSPAKANMLGRHIANPINLEARSFGILSSIALGVIGVSCSMRPWFQWVNGSVIIATPSTAKPISQGYSTLHIAKDLQQQMACILVNFSPNSIQHNKPVGKGRQQYIVKNSDIVR